MSAQLTPQVEAVANDASRGEDSFDVVIELEPPQSQPGGNRSQRISQQRDRFDRLAAPVKAAVEDSGGTVYGEAWINSTIKVRVAAKMLKQLCEVDGIVRIDVPHAISREG